MYKKPEWIEKCEKEAKVGIFHHLTLEKSIEQDNISWYLMFNTPTGAINGIAISKQCKDIAEMLDYAQRNDLPLFINGKEVHL